MLDIYWLGGGLDWFWNVQCAMLKIYHVWELIIQVQQSTGVRRKGSGGDCKLGHFHITLGSVLAALLGVASAYSCTAGLWLGAPGTGASPFLFHVSCSHIRLEVKGQVLISEPSVNLQWCSLWSQRCFLYICICATETRIRYKVTSFFCPFLWFLLLECCYLENMFSFTDT